jgi:hypothetical protein
MFFALRGKPRLSWRGVLKLVIAISLFGAASQSTIRELSRVAARIEMPRAVISTEASSFVHVDCF